MLCIREVRSQAQNCMISLHCCAVKSRISISSRFVQRIFTYLRHCTEQYLTGHFAHFTCSARTGVIGQHWGYGKVVFWLPKRLTFSSADSSGLRITASVTFFEIIIFFRIGLTSCNIRKHRIYTPHSTKTDLKQEDLPGKLIHRWRNLASRIMLCPLNEELLEINQQMNTFICLLFQEQHEFRSWPSSVNNNSMNTW